MEVDEIQDLINRVEQMRRQLAAKCTDLLRGLAKHTRA